MGPAGIGPTLCQWQERPVWVLERSARVLGASSPVLVSERFHALDSQKCITPRFEDKAPPRFLSFALVKQGWQPLQHTTCLVY